MKFRIVILTLVVLLLPAAVFSHPNDRGDKTSEQQLERTVAVDPAVTVSVCIMSGSISVRGWDKHEIMARSNHVSQMELRTSDAQKPTGGPATKVTVLLEDNSDERPGRRGCRAFADLELTVPRGASVYVQTEDGVISVADVATVYAVSQSGDIEISKASRSIEARSFGSDISVKDSNGRVALKSIGGTLTAEHMSTNQRADSFEAVTISGDVNLDHVTHSQISIRTVNGDVNFDGPLTRGGQYNFNTTRGDVTLSLPSDASFRLHAKLAEDAQLTSDFALINQPQPPTPVAPTPAKETLPTAQHPKGQAPATPATPNPSDPPLIIRVDPKIKMTVTPKTTIVKSDPLVVSAVYLSRHVNVVYGNGEANITVISFSGSLRLEKN